MSVVDPGSGSYVLRAELTSLLDNIYGKYNSLVDKYNTLIGTCKTIDAELVGIR